MCLHPLQLHPDHLCSLANEQPSQRSDISAADHVHTINNPERFESLDDYLNIIRTNAIGKGSRAPLIPDDPHERAQPSQLYTKSTIKGSGSTFQERTSNRHFERKMITGGPSTPNAQKDFTRVAWAQLTQFDKMALMTGLQDELDSVRQYNIELITQTGVYNYYNLYVMQELAYGNEPIDLSLLEIWSAEGRPPLICFPIHNSPSNGI